MEYIWEEKGVSQYRTNGIYLGREGRGVPNIGPMDYIWEKGVSQYRTNGLYLGGEGSFPISDQWNILGKGGEGSSQYRTNGLYLGGEGSFPI